MIIKQKKFKKFLSAFIALLMIFNVFISVPRVKAAEPETVAAWDYTAIPASAVVPATSGANSTGAVLTNFSNITPGYSSSSLSIAGWDGGANTKYWQISLSTRGYENLTLSAKTRSSGTGPRDFKLIYSIDSGAAWNDVPNSSYSITSTTLGNFMNSPIPLPADASNVDTLLIRFIMTSNTSSRAGTGTYSSDETVAAGGTSNINNINVTGTQTASTTTVGSISAVPGSSAVPLNSKVALTCETDGAAIMYSVNDSPNFQYNPDQQITLDTLPATIKAYGTREGLTDGAASTFNYTQAQAAAVKASPNSGAVDLNQQITLSCDTPNANIKYSQDDGTTYSDYSSPIALTKLPALITAYAVADGYLDSEKTTFNYTLKTSGEYNLYFGQLHSHTNYSDGIGTPDDAYSHAKDAAKVDFLAVTDHSNSLDNAANSNMGDASNSPEWINGHAIADKYTDSTFVGIYGYEMTWSNGTGHINTFNTKGFESRDNQIYKNADGLQQYYNVLKQYPDSISQFNHPGTTFGDFNDFADYDPQIDKQISLIEVGNGEGAVRSNLYFPSYEYYWKALDKGWHLSPTNNQDNHLGNWGDSNTARTVILADSLTRDNIYDAMKNMRTYATEDNDLRIKYTLNGNVMGTILNQTPADVDIKVDLEDPDNEALGTVSVISDGGKVVESKTLTDSKDSLEFNLSPDNSYYYIRVDEADKDIAVTAPVWIKDVDKAGISNTAGNTALPMKGEKFTVTTNLFNNESVPMNIKSLEYSIDGNVINTAPALDPVNSLGTSSYSFDYIPDTAGKFTIDVRLIAIINGMEKLFTDKLEISVGDPATITRVLVDASHNNDYVSGYYAGNMTNFIALANGENISVILQKDKLTRDTLQNVQLLILAPPAKKAGTVNKVPYTISPYTDDEIEAIKWYADNGGNIIVTALADYQDSRNDSTNHSAYQQNLILEAIGAETRINDDEVVDYDNNPNVPTPGVAGGTPYRVPMNVYNMDTPYLDGVVIGQNYSFYSGCSITPGKDSVWLVKGTPTTYGFDSDNDGRGGTYVAAANKTIPADTGIGKGNVAALAVEKLPGGGRLFVGGTVFYSNFEIKTQLDNASQLQNSNYNITMNILDSIRKVFPISDVRSAENGASYCVEGIVTAGKVPEDNSFFDTLYIQDATGGINLFPVSGGDIKVGQKVKAAGTVDEYQGDKELRVTKVIVTDAAINPLEPVRVSTKDAMDSKNGGMLLMIEGTVTRMDSQNIYVDDGSGEARAFVDGYIGDGNGGSKGLWDPNIKAGKSIRITGLASVDTSGPRLRVRNTGEITLDKIPPVITVSGIKDGDIVKLNQSINITWTAADEWTGIKSKTDNLINGTMLDTSKPGPQILTLTAVDNEENTTTIIINYYVQYDYSGVLSPLSNKEVNIIKPDRTVPVKFQLKDASGAYVTNVQAAIYITSDTTDNKSLQFVPLLADPKKKDSNIFRYDSKDNQYIFNLNMKDYKSGTYQIKIDLGDGTVNIITIKK